MKTQSRDTHPEIERRLIEGYRRMSAAEKFQRVRELNQFVEMMQTAETRRQHPGASEEECRLRVASRRIPADLMRKAFDWDPETMGY